MGASGQHTLQQIVILMKEAGPALGMEAIVGRTAACHAFAHRSDVSTRESAIDEDGRGGVPPGSQDRADDKAAIGCICG